MRGKSVASLPRLWCLTNSLVVVMTNKFTELRRRVIRRCVHGLNCLALRDDRVPSDGVFVADAANGLAAIVVYSGRGLEYQSNQDRSKTPLEVLKIVRDSVEFITKEDNFNHKHQHP